ncbi:head-tail connector protein [uncultured Litoreibacter sp.]|uniref:head-tail connector protein n=1 Tax=uncultured Litoreibacter sp. TaxID=1392394 RepID=UPI002629B008|nr:head-tail connector protein [uncultured Litoreibacter sp.]
MELVDLTTTPLEALPLEPFKAHLRLGSGFADDSLQDDLLAGYLRATLAAIEARTGKILFERILQWRVTRWAEDGHQPLPVAPVTAMTSVALRNVEGVVSDVDLQLFGLERDTHRPRLFAKGRSLPAITEDGEAIVSFTAGFGSSWDDIPADLQQAVLMLGAHYYEHRNEVSGAARAMPFGVVSLLEPYRNIRVLGARS